jgi:hypothetical protein
MWEDDGLWMPLVLAGNKIVAVAEFNNKEERVLLDFKYKLVSSF